MNTTTIPTTEAGVRLDKWLWAVRLFKTRSQAADACRLQRVRWDQQEVKASRMVKIGDVYEVHQEEMVRTVRVKALLERRIAGKFVPDFLEDLTPAEVVEAARKQREERRLSPVVAPEFKPSKKDRELLKKLYQPPEE
jgi:ribosome-associated heat shock protein Hsp15